MSERTKAVLAWCKANEGLPYRWGAKGPGAYDCSGWAHKAMLAGGVALPAGDAAAQFYRTRVPGSGLREIGVEAALHTPAALLFVQSRARYPLKRGGIGHVAISAGDGRRVWEAQGKKAGCGRFSAYRTDKHGNLVRDKAGNPICRFNLAAKAIQLYP